MTRARYILEWHNEISEVDPLTAAGVGLAGAAVGAGALKAKQMIQKARKEHGTVRHAAYLKGRAVGAKGLRKTAQKSSQKIYKLAKKLETPQPRKIDTKKNNEEYNVKQDWQKTKSTSGQAVRDAGNVVKRAAVGAGNLVKKGYQANLANRRKIVAKNQNQKQQRRLGSIERKKVRVQAKHDLKLHKKRLKADQKLYKYDPLIH